MRSTTRRLSRTTASVLLFLSSLGGCSDGTGPEGLPPGHIIFELYSAATDRSDIWIMNHDGTGARQLTDNAFAEFYPQISPDGRRFAYTSQEFGAGDIYVANVDGSGTPTRLTTHAAWEGYPRWSPDGTKIAFESQRDGYIGIYIMNADGSNYHALTPSTYSADRPAWSPDGQQIVFESNFGTGGLTIINADGTGVRILTPGGRNPAWAPGSEIIFDNGGHIHAIMPDGTGQRQVTSGSGSNDFPSWSLDGTRIVFDSERGVRNLFVIDSDGTNERRLTNGAQGDEYWSPTWGR